MGSRHHHSHSRYSRRRGSRTSSLIWLVLSVVLVSVLLFVTAGGEQPLPETPPRRYPGTPGSHKSQILPRNARQASEQFHRTYNDVDTVYRSDRSTSRSDRPSEKRESEPKSAQKQSLEQKPAKSEGKPVARPAAAPKPKR